ncbi:hypothetical protein ACO22_04143 [Paracoccidioides brasiliensis]|uniref:Uncharacterized protein n=1 Tax=Paracoccidioides brasiliensis TaxID=121759 RepID=A0A1D2JE34_PARBR|nr:hypothetical protein ACO22_04143 [Paracoccidioides brasiliensis]
MRECSVIPFIPFHPVQFIILETQSHTSRKETNAKSEFFDTPGNFDCCWRQEDTGSYLQNYAGKSAHVERTATANKHTISALMESMPAGSLIQLNPNIGRPELYTKQAQINTSSATSGFPTELMLWLHAGCSDDFLAHIWEIMILILIKVIARRNANAGGLGK